MSQRTHFLWIDLETTDGNPQAALLEYAYALTTKSGNLIAATSSVVVPPTTPAPDMPDIVRDMHTESGLLEILPDLAPIHDETAALTALLNEIRSLKTETNATLVLAGSGIAHFDVPWLRARNTGQRILNECEYYLHDIGILRRALRAADLDPPRSPSSSGTAKAHRALADTLAHIEEWRTIREYLSTLAPPPQRFACCTHCTHAPRTHAAPCPSGCSQAEETENNHA